jgi:hypothetical protein
VIKNKLHNYLIPFKNGCLMHIDPNLYIKCSPGGIIVGDWCKYKCFGVDTMKVPLPI